MADTVGESAAKVLSVFARIQFLMSSKYNCTTKIHRTQTGIRIRSALRQPKGLNEKNFKSLPSAKGLFLPFTSRAKDSFSPAVKNKEK